METLVTTQLLEMRGIGKSFPGVHALRDVELRLNAGEVVALLGENGAGKSTLINILSGVFNHYDGDITLAGNPVVLHTPTDSQRLGISTIHQELNLVASMSIADNIWLGREQGKGGFVNRRKSLDSAKALLARVGLDLEPTTPVSQLRVAEQQLVEVAKALSIDAKILIMDEPTSALADAEVQKLFDVIRSLTAEGVGIIYVSHRLEELEVIADRVNVLRDGCWVGEKDMAGTSRAELIRMMVGRDVSDLPRREEGAADAQGEPRLRVRDLRLEPDALAGRVELKGIDFDVRPGEIVGLAGLMGAGRTETLESLFGGYPPNVISGHIELDGATYQPTNPRHAIESGFALVAEDRKQQSLLLDMSVKFNASLAALGRFTTGGFVKQRDEARLVDSEIKALGVKTPSAESAVGTLSGGNQQKVVLAKCLLTKPSVILLDEPTRGIDVGAKAEIYELVNELAEQGVAIVVASSELPELLRMCNKIVVLCEGRKTAELDAATTNQEEILSAAMDRTQAVTVQESTAVTDGVEEGQES